MPYHIRLHLFTCIENIPIEIVPFRVINRIDRKDCDIAKGSMDADVIEYLKSPKTAVLTCIKM
jgi:hypothetical protein